MKAYKCDRCGLLFERKVEIRRYLITNAIISIGSYYDLCEHCQIGLDEWMDEFKDKENPCEDCYCNDGEVHTECGVICEEKKMNKRPKKYDTRDVVYDPSSGETNIKLTIPQEDIEKGLKGTQYSKHKWESIDIRLIYKNGKPNFAYIPQESELDKMKSEIKNVAFDYQEIDGEHESFMVVDLNDVLQIIDKYKAESEE